MILATRTGDMELRSGLTELLAQYGLGRSGYGPTAGLPVTSQTIAGVPAVHAAVTFAAEAVACLKMRVFRGDGPIQERVNSTWQARLFGSGRPNPTQDWFIFWETVQSSLDYSGNGYIWKSKDNKNMVSSMWALHPDQVTLRRQSDTKKIKYRVTSGGAYPTPYEMSSYDSVEVDDGQIIHIRNRGSLGALATPSPITLFRTALAVSLAKSHHEARLYENGAIGGLVVQFPQGTTKQQAEIWKESFAADHSGISNVGKTKVVGGGAKVDSVGMTPSDMQFIESVNLSILDISRIFRVPTWFLGISDSTNKPQNPEHEQQRWRLHGLSPRLHRIEQAINADNDLFGNSNYHAAFDTSELIHGDLETEAMVSVQKVQAGIWSQDEARAKDGLLPWPDGMGATAQPIPVGGSPVGVTLPDKKNDEDEEE